MTHVAPTGAPVLASRDGPVVTLELNRPERRNALSAALMEELTGALRELGRDTGVRAVVLGARGPAFSAGHDLRELADGGAGEHRLVFDRCAELMLTIHALPQPVIARVQGIATAAGCQLVAACDLAVASETAAFATPGVRIGLFCSTPAVEVVRAVGRARAMEMLLTGDPVDAATAREWGLVSRVVPPGRLDEEAAALAARVAAASRAAVATGKRSVNETIDAPLEEAYRTASAAMCANAAHEDAREGMRAFLEKRAPVWSHR